MKRKKKNRNSSENDLNDFLANNDDDTLLFNIEKDSSWENKC